MGSREGGLQEQRDRKGGGVGYTKQSDRKERGRAARTDELEGSVEETERYIWRREERAIQNKVIGRLEGRAEGNREICMKEGGKGL
jgi:hypothetical protein